MKCLLVLLSIAAVAWGQGHTNCDCGIFVSTDHREIEVRRLASIAVHDCNDETICDLRCKTEFEALINNGGLDWVDPQGGHSLGDECCHILDEFNGTPDFDSHKLYAYSRLCEGPWWYIEDDRNGKDNLCCVGGNYPGNCPAPK